MAPDDVAVVFFAGHGFKRDDSAEMIFLTPSVSADEASIEREGIRWTDVATGLAAARGRALVLLDACHSGHITRSSVVQNSDLADLLARQQRAGAIVFAAAKGNQVSFEPDNARTFRLKAAPLTRKGAPGHGYFTAALLAALRAPATDLDADGAVQVSELIEEVTRQVARATDQRQTPWVARRELFGDFTLAAPPPRHR
jgi:hypothetical protein